MNSFRRKRIISPSFHSFVLFFIILLLAVLGFQACKKSPTSPPVEPLKPKINLAVDDTTCIEAWIKLSVENGSYPMQLSITQDGVRKRQFTLYQQDTLLFYDSLLPARNYAYLAVLRSDTSVHQSLTVRTMDTTGHNFIWQTWTIGQNAGSCLLRDAAIINDTNVWAVGEVHMLDSLGYPDPQQYNAVHWDGKTVEIKKLIYYYQGANYGPMYSVFAPKENDIWFGSGCFIHWNGIEYSSIKLESNIFPSIINKIYGITDKIFYMVGNSGSIALYNNNIWSKINSKTSTDIIDIWGLQDKAGSYTELYVPRGSLMMLDKYNDATVFPILPEMHVFSVWAKNIHKIYAAGNGLYIYTNGLWKKDMHEGVQSLYRVRGNNCNDMFGVGGNGSVVYHFNGYTWQPIYTETANVFGSLTVKGNTIVAVGYRAGTQNAIVTIIRRSN